MFSKNFIGKFYEIFNFVIVDRNKNQAIIT